MVIFILILGIILLSVLFRKREEHRLSFGKDHILRKFKQGGHTFIYEEASFGASQETVYYTYQLGYMSSLNAKAYWRVNTIYTIFLTTSSVMKKQP